MQGSALYLTYATNITKPEPVDAYINAMLIKKNIFLLKNLEVRFYKNWEDWVIFMWIVLEHFYWKYMIWCMQELKRAFFSHSTKLITKVSQN